MKLIVAISFLLVACTRSKDTIGKMPGENKLEQSITTSTAKVVLQVVPSHSAKSKVNAGKGTNDSFIFFKAAVVFNNSERRIGFAETEYLNFGIEKDFRLIIGNDSISPAFCHRIMGVDKNMLRYIIAFPKGENLSKQESINLFLDDQQLGVGKVTATFKTSVLQK